MGGDEAQVLDAWKRFTARGTEPFDPLGWFEHALQELGPVAARIYAPGVLGHGFHLTEDLVRTPLVVVDAGRCAPGGMRDELRSQVDLFPTLLDLAGLAPDQHGIADRSFLRSPGRIRCTSKRTGAAGISTPRAAISAASARRS